MLEVYEFIKGDRDDPGKWGAVFDAQLTKASKKMTWTPLSAQKPKVKSGGKWV